MKVSKEALELAKGLWLPRNVVTEKINILGQSGGGKTYLAMKLAELMLQALAQIVVIDLVGVWWGLRSSSDGLSPGFPVLVIGGDHADLPLNPRSGKLIADLVVDRRIPVVLDVSDLDEEEMAEFVADFLHHLFRRKKTQPSPLHLFFEEAQELFPETLSSKIEVRLRRVGTRICKIGRNRGIGYTTVTQEPQSTSKRILNQAGTIIAVRTIGSQEREAVARTARSRTRSKADLNLIEVLPELETGQAIVFSPAWLRFIGQVSILPKRTFDSSKTPEVGEEAVMPEVLAPVEVEQLREAMAESVAAAEAQDVGALQRRIKQLEIKLASVPPPAAPIEVPAMTVEQVAVIKGLGHQLLGATVALVEIEKKLGILPTAHRGAGITTAITVPATMAKAIERAPKTVATAPSKTDYERLYTPAERKAREQPPQDAPLGKGPQKMFEVVARAHPKPVTLSQLALLSGFSKKGGSFRTYLPRLSTLGLVERVEGDSVALTAAGVAQAAGIADVDPAERVAEWKQKLGGGTWKMLEELTRAYPQELSQAQLAHASGFSKAGGSFRTYLPRLVTQGLAERVGENVKLTAAALELLGDMVNTAPKTHREIVDGWRAKLGGGAWRMLEELLGAYPKHLTRAELAARSGFELSGGSFRTYLPKLRTLGLAVVNDQAVSASPTLWP